MRQWANRSGVAATSVIIMAAMVAAAPGASGKIIHAAPGATPSVRVATAPAALLDLQRQLVPVLHQSLPVATLKFADDELVGQYQTQQFMVHSVYMSGEISRRAFPTWGPNYQGFLLRLRVNKEPYSGQSAQPYGVWHRQYWDEYINEYQLPHQSGVLRLELAYGVRTDRKLLDQIKQVVAAYAPSLNPLAQPQPTATAWPEATVFPEATVAPTPSAEKGIAHVAAVQNKVEVKTGAAEYHTATLGSTIHSGDMARTGKRSKVDIKFTDGSLLRLGQNTEVLITDAVQVKVLSGQAMLVSLHDPRGLQFITPAGSSPFAIPAPANP